VWVRTSNEPERQYYYLGYPPFYTRRVHVNCPPSSITMRLNPLWWMWFL